MERRGFLVLQIFSSLPIASKCQNRNNHCQYWHWLREEDSDVLKVSRVFAEWQCAAGLACNSPEGQSIGSPSGPETGDSKPGSGSCKQYRPPCKSRGCCSSRCHSISLLIHWLTHVSKTSLFPGETFQIQDGTSQNVTDRWNVLFNILLFQVIFTHSQQNKFDTLLMEKKEND